MGGYASYSDAIDVLVAELRVRFGLKINMFAFDAPAGGGIHYATGSIEVNVGPALPALLTLAHEAGHWLHHLRDPRFRNDDESRAGGRHERKAFLYGWAVLVSLGMAEMVGRQAWRQYHPEVPGAGATEGFWEGEEGRALLLEL